MEAREWDDTEPEETERDERDFSAFIGRDENLEAVAMAALARGYSLVEDGEDPGAVAEALALLMHESGEVPDDLRVLDWAVDYFERVPGDDFRNQYVSSAAIGVLDDEDTEQIAASLDAALEQVKFDGA